MRTPPPVKAIRNYCLECSGGQPSEVRKCPITQCPLYPFRFATNPNRAGVGPGKIITFPKNRVESVKITKDEVLDNEFTDLRHAEFV